MHSGKGIGTLYVVATPIGNLEDITFRALNVLKGVDLIACEDTRHTRKLLTYYGIEGKKLVPYHEHNEEEQSEKLISLLLQGKNVALVSDSGTPSISDPGYRVVKRAREMGIKVVPVPGPSAVIAALSACGFPTDTFAFFGFLPRKEKKLLERLEEIFSFPGTSVCYESPHRIERTLEIVGKHFPKKELGVFKEITKLNEKFYRGTAKEVLSKLREEGAVRGEFVILFPPEKKEVKENSRVLAEKLAEEMIMEKKMSVKDAVKKIKSKVDLPKREIYEIVLKKAKES